MRFRRSPRIKRDAQFVVAAASRRMWHRRAELYEASAAMASRHATFLSCTLRKATLARFQRRILPRKWRGHSAPGPNHANVHASEDTRSMSSTHFADSHLCCSCSSSADKDPSTSDSLTRLCVSPPPGKRGGHRESKAASGPLRFP